MYINNEDEDNQGLFAELNGTVKNLTIDESLVKGNSYVGSIAGVNNGTIQKCYNKGTIIGNSEVTGGYLQSSTTGDIINMWDTDFLTENTLFVSGEEEYTAVVPIGFRVSLDVLEQSVSTGMVIEDSNENEFVWIPIIGNLVNPYQYESSKKEPKVLVSDYDGQSVLDENYGVGKFNYANDFQYINEYNQMVTKVNLYHGFYIGRYETTIDDEENIGSVYNTPVVTAEMTLFTENSIDYQYKWYGLYYKQKITDFVIGNGNDVQTAMIYGQLWDKTMEYIRAQRTNGKTTYNVDAGTASWHGESNGHAGIVNSGQANLEDVALNIYDLESNALEWTQEANGTGTRVYRRLLLQKYRNSIFKKLYYPNKQWYEFFISNDTLCKIVDKNKNS